MEHRSIAIDGPSGAGKSTLARAVAQKLGYVYVDTGAIYRTLGLYVHRMGANPSVSEQVKPLLGQCKITMAYQADGLQHMYLDGEDVTGEIRHPHISSYASQISAQEDVRAYLLNMQRELAKQYDVVMDGRDIGTVVLPQADVKIFLTATPEARARRRLEELQSRGEDAQYDKVLEELKARDDRDTHRAAAPLRQAEDAVLVDTTSLDLDQSLAALLDVIGKRVGK